MAGGASFALDWLRERSRSGTQDKVPTLDDLSFVGVRVVHGGADYTHAVPFTASVQSDIKQLEELAPLHNKSSLQILSVLSEELPHIPRMVAFDTAFHRTLPEVAWRYPIDRTTADRFGIRKFGFHGLSHRYMLEHYALTSSKNVDDVNIVTLHLESGCSAAAIARGKSVDTTMGLTPLEGLMMGTRSGSIDPAVIPYLMQKLNTNVDEVMKLLNKESGMLGIAGETFDTRVLVKRGDDAAKLALAMFSYRARLAVGAYLAALGNAEAVVFGGGIGEDTPSVRASICEGLSGWGMDFDIEANSTSTAGAARISRPRSRLHAYVVPVEEGLQIAHECYRELPAPSTRRS